MKSNSIKNLFACLAVLAGAVTLRAQSGVDIIVNESVTAAALDKNALKDIFTGKTAYWEGGQAVTIIVLADKTDAALEQVSGMSASQFKTHWQRLTFSGRGKQPKTIDAADKVVEQVAQTKGAVAIVPAGTVLSGVKKIEVK